LRPDDDALGDIAIGIAVAKLTSVGHLLGRLNQIPALRVEILAFLYAYVSTWLRPLPLATYEVAEEMEESPS
jgi:hypothetical protein